MTTTTDNDTEFSRAIDALMSDARSVRAAVTVYDGGSGASQRYADEVAEALSTMELDLAIARASLAARVADSSDGLEAAVHDVTEAARRWLDDSAVQSQLARMDLRDRADIAAHRLDRAGAEVRRAGSRVADVVGTDLNEMRKMALSSITSLRDTVSDAATALRGTA